MDLLADEHPQRWRAGKPARLDVPSGALEQPVAGGEDADEVPGRRPRGEADDGARGKAERVEHQPLRGRSTAAAPASATG